MSKLLSEQKVLKALEIPDFRHLTKDKVVRMASMLDRMEPEVAKKAIEQFPNFSETAKTLVADYQEKVSTALENNEKNMLSYGDFCNRTLDILSNELNKEDLSFEDRKYIIDCILEISRRMGEKDSENKKFLLVMSAITGTVALAVTGILASALGSRASISTDEDDDYDEIYDAIPEDDD